MPLIHCFHAHIYFNENEMEAAKAFAASAEARFGVHIGRFHLRPVGPHPRGSCQLTVQTDIFGDFTNWAPLQRGELTVFAHAETDDALTDHTQHVIWFGPSEKLDLTGFGS